MLLDLPFDWQCRLSHRILATALKCIHEFPFRACWNLANLVYMLIVGIRRVIAQFTFTTIKCTELDLIAWRLYLLLLLLLFITAAEFSPGGSSPYTNTDKRN